MHSAIAIGVMEIEKRYHGEAEPFEVVREDNALVTDGLQHMLERIGGISTSSPLSSSSVVRIYNSSDVFQKQIIGTSGGPTHSLSGNLAQVVLEWVDSSDDEYDVHTGRVYFAGNTIQVNNATFTPTGTKGQGQTWTYRFTLTFKPGDSSPVIGEGLDRALRCVTGNSGLTWNGSRTEVEIRSDGGFTCEGNLIGTMTPSSVTRVSSDGERLRWTFVAEGSLVGQWECLILRNTGSPEVEMGRMPAVGVAQGPTNERTLRVDFRLGNA